MPPANPIDVAVLQAEIDRLAPEAGPEPPFPQLRLQQLLPVLREAVRVEPNPPLIGRTLYEQIWVVINRVIRRGASPGVEPGVLRQNDVNAGVQRALEGLMRADADLAAEVVRLQADRKRHGA